MTERRDELQAVAAEVRDHGVVEHAFVAKSFSDLLVIVDVVGESLPPAVESRLEEQDLLPAESVYGDDEDASSLLGPVEEGTRHHFVDVRTRGDHRTQVVE